MRRLNVRCCCQPTKILGTLPWDESSEQLTFAMTDGRKLTLCVQQIVNRRMTAPANIVVARLIMPLDEPIYSIETEMAYKAEGAPLEELRLIPQFREYDQILSTGEQHQRTETIEMTTNSITEVGIGVAENVTMRVERTTFEHPLIIRGDLTRFEQLIFNLLTQRQGQVVSKSDIAKVLYTDGTTASSNTIEVFVRRLRQKIGEDRITTKRGKGYVLNPPDVIDKVA